MGVDVISSVGVLEIVIRGGDVEDIEEEMVFVIVGEDAGMIISIADRYNSGFIAKIPNPLMTKINNIAMMIQTEILFFFFEILSKSLILYRIQWQGRFFCGAIYL